MYTVKFNLHTPLSKLEAHRNKRYSYAEIANKSGISRQGVRRLLTEGTKQLEIATIEKLLSFFESEGMPVQVGELFVVERGE